MNLTFHKRRERQESSREEKLKIEDEREEKKTCKLLYLKG